MSEKKKEKKDDSSHSSSTLNAANTSTTKDKEKESKKSAAAPSSSSEQDEKKKSKEKETHSTSKEKKEEPTESKDEDISDAGEEEVVVDKADKVGYMEMRIKEKTWRAVYCVLIKGSFFYYKNAQDSEPTGSIALKKATLQEKPEGMEGKKFVLVFECSEEKEKNNANFTASLGSQSEFQEWIQALKKNKDLEESPPPTKERRKKDSVMTRMKKRVAGNAASSPLGKKVVKSIINEETTALLNAMKRIVKKVDSQKKADELEKNIIKLAVKAFMLVENKKLNGDDFLAADGPLREAFELLIKCYNAKGRVQEHVLKDALKRVEAIVKRAEQVITGLLAPHLTNKNMFRLQNTFGYLSNPEFLQKVFLDSTLDSEVEKLIDAMEYYTQFHYHV